MTLASYVPKKNKAVILLSTMHHDDRVDDNNAKKPEMITYYNATKSGVDNLDHLVGTYKCRRKTRRWPMTIFFNVIDTAAVASYVTWCAKHPQYQDGKSHKRRLFLVDLAHGLVRQQLERRKENPRVMQTQVKLAFRAIGMDVAATPVQHQAPTDTVKKRYVACPRSVDRKTKTKCSDCGNPCCQEHYKILCPHCVEHSDVDI